MTRVAYLDCPSGVSGDMLLGAMLDAGLDLDSLRAALAALPLAGYTLEADPVVRGALGATHARVVPTREEREHRSLSDVLAIVEGSTLPGPVKLDAARVFRRLAEAEARVHRVGVDEVHFHEVGAVDAIVDVVGACAGLRLLGIKELYCSPLPLGRGSARMAHGILPLPAPAVLELVAGTSAPTVPHEATTELVTPTGAALVTTLARFAQPPMTIIRVGYGAGTRAEPAPNLLRLWLGDRAAEADAAGREAPGRDLTVEDVVVLEANIDDMPAELFGHAIERLLEAGALDAWCAPLTMKKSRPATMLSVLCRPDDRPVMLDLLLRETSTFGVRARAVTRYAVARETRHVETPYGLIAVKLKILDGVVVGASPEYDDCRRAAAVHNVPLPPVYAAALAAASSPNVS